MENVTEMIYETIAVIVFGLAVAFVFMTFRTGGSNTDAVNSEIQEKMDIRADNQGYTGKNIVTGANVYYDTIASADEIKKLGYAIVLNNQTLDVDTIILPAANGEGTELRKLIDMTASYEKTYIVDSEGNTSQIVYTKTPR